MTQSDSPELNSENTYKDPLWFKCVLAIGMLIFSFYASTHMVAAGDTWVALACGRHFANHGVDTVEPFSFNAHKPGPTEEQLAAFPKWSHNIIRKWHPTGWIDQNWLTQVIFYQWAKWGGSDGTYNYDTLVYWKFILYGLTVFSVFAAARIIGVGNLLAAAGACFAMVVGRTFFDIRPAGYSNLLVPVLILILVLAVYRNYRFVWLIVPVIVFWANVHGGYLYAFIMLVPFIGIHTLLRLPKRWSISLGFIGLWLVLYLMSYKFLSNNIYIQVHELTGKTVNTPSLINDKMLFIWITLAIASVVLVLLKNISAAPIYAYHLGINAIYFLSLIPRFLSSTAATGLAPQSKAIYSSFVSGSQMLFIFVFIAGTLLILAMVLKKDRFVILPAKGIFHVIAASFVSFVMMIVLNPFHLTNLTHTFEISISKHAESWRQVNEWKPAFDWMDKTTNTPNPVGEEKFFGVLCIITFIVMILWAAGLFLKPRRRTTKKSGSVTLPLPDTIQWPQIDLALIVISLLTVYMAIRSRRFIAIAGSAAAPAVVLMAAQSWQMMTGRIRWTQKQDARPIVIPGQIRKFLYIGVTGVICLLGVFWAAKYKRVYLDPWPTYNRYDSVFMRMTSSQVKPHEVCEFINLNHISGRVFNYWTEGGAIAFGQIPDPKTGQTPLQLFMDGRAQAAYNHDKFIQWKEIYAGSRDGIEASGILKQIEVLRTNKKTNTDAYKNAVEQYSNFTKKSGEWIASRLTKDQVWVTLVPQSESDSIFISALKTTDHWKTAFLDNAQLLMVDIDTPQGRKLIEDILSGNTVYPDDFSKNLSTAAVIIDNKISTRYTELYTLTKQAFDIYPYPTATLALARLASLSIYRDTVIKDLQRYLDDYTENKESYMKEGGFFLRLSSANIAAHELANLQPNQQAHYLLLLEEIKSDIKSVNKRSIW